MEQPIERAVARMVDMLLQFFGGASPVGCRNCSPHETPVALLAAIVLAEVWRATAIVLVILVAGLQLIPKEFGEAADIFGATPWTALPRITLPLLKPTLQSALILRTVLAFEVFAVVYALGGRNFPVSWARPSSGSTTTRTTASPPPMRC